MKPPSDKRFVAVALFFMSELKTECNPERELP